MDLISNATKLGLGLKGFKLAKKLLKHKDISTSLISKGQEGFLQDDNYYQNSKATSILGQRGLGQNALAAAGLFAGGKVAYDALTGKYRTNGKGSLGSIIKNVGKSAVKGLLVFGVAKQGYQFLQHPSLKQGLKLAASVGIAALGTKLLNRNQDQQHTTDQTKQQGLGGLLNSKPLKFLGGVVLGSLAYKAISKQKKSLTPQLGLG